MRSYIILIDQSRKVVLDILPFSIFEASGWVSGVRHKYDSILKASNTNRRLGWVDCRTPTAKRKSREWLKKNGYT